MMEYRVQEFTNGEWETARIPFKGRCKTTHNIADAYDLLKQCKDEWADACKLNKDNINCMPEQYRIVAREVSEWQVVAH